MILLGGGAAVYTGYVGWRCWGNGLKTAAAGAMLLAVAALAVPVALALLGR